MKNNKQAPFTAKQKRLLSANKYLYEIHKGLLNKPTKQEMIVMEMLNSMGVKFIFQHRIDCVEKTFFVDFYIPKPYRVIIEVDGYRHFTKHGKKKDKARSKLIARDRPGVEIMRFSNGFVDKHREGLEYMLAERFLNDRPFGVK